MAGFQLAGPAADVSKILYGDFRKSYQSPNAQHRSSYSGSSRDEMISREELIHFKIGYINHVYTSSGEVHEITYVGSETPFSEELTMAKAVDSLSELERPSPVTTF